MFDFIYDLELDTTALVVTLIISGVFGLFFFSDPLNVGLLEMPLGYRLIGWIGGTIVSYFVAARMLNN